MVAINLNSNLLISAHVDTLVHFSKAALADFILKNVLSFKAILISLRPLLNNQIRSRPTQFWQLARTDVPYLFLIVPASRLAATTGILGFHVLLLVFSLRDDVVFLQFSN